MDAAKLLLLAMVASSTIPKPNGSSSTLAAAWTTRCAGALGAGLAGTTGTGAGSDSVAGANSTSDWEIIEADGSGGLGSST